MFEVKLKIDCKDQVYTETHEAIDRQTLKTTVNQYVRNIHQNGYTVPENAKLNRWYPTVNWVEFGEITEVV